MAATFPSSTNVFVPAHDAANGLVVNFSRNQEDFAVNRYAQLVPQDKVSGFWLEITVEQAVLAALTQPESGLLARENIPIGCPVFRSRIFEQVLSVEGVATVRGASLDGQTPTPKFITTLEGHYRDFTGGLVVGSSTL